MAPTVSTCTRLLPKIISWRILECSTLDKVTVNKLKVLVWCQIRAGAHSESMACNSILRAGGFTPLEVSGTAHVCCLFQC
jgi:hypothetical protein